CPSRIPTPPAGPTRATNPAETSDRALSTRSTRGLATETPSTHPLCERVLAKYRWLQNRDHLVRPALCPGRRRALADSDRDHRKRRHVDRPRREAVRHHDEHVDRRGLAVDER